MLNNRLLFISCALLGILVLPLHADMQKSLSVQVKEGQVRATPSFLGKMIARVVYGDRVNLLQEQGDWKKVSIPGIKIQGWMHLSALTTQRIILKAGQANVQTGATREELALAGKGFNEQVEASFRKENKSLDYSWINRMETFRISPEQVQRFIDGGNLVPLEEGGKS